MYFHPKILTSRQKNSWIQINYNVQLGNPLHDLKILHTVSDCLHEYE